MNPQIIQPAQPLQQPIGSKPAAITALVIAVFAILMAVIAPIAMFLLAFNDTGSSRVTTVTTVALVVAAIAGLAQAITLMVLAKTARTYGSLNGWSFWIGAILFATILLSVIFVPLGWIAPLALYLAFLIAANILPILFLTSIILTFVLAIKQLRSK